MWALLIGGNNWSWFFLGVNYLTFCDSCREWLGTSSITFSAWFNQILNWHCDQSIFCQKSISLTMNPRWPMKKQMTGTNTIRFCHFHILDLSLSYFQPIKIVKRFSFSCDNRARRWLAGSWSDFPLYISNQKDLFFKHFSFSINNRERRWLAGTQSDLFTSTLFCPEAVFQVQRSMNVTQ